MSDGPTNKDRSAEGASPFDAALSLDTEELRIGGVTTDVLGGADIMELEIEPDLELDTGEFRLEAALDAAADAHDAWTEDSLNRKSLPPPSPEGRLSSARLSRVSSMRRSLTPPPMPAASEIDAISAGPDDGHALSLVDRSRASTPDLDYTTEIADRFAVGDFTGALVAAELVLGRDPGDADARRYADLSRARLEQLYTSRLGGMMRVPRVSIAGSEMRWLGLDHRAGFLLSRVDASATIEEIIDVSGMQRLEALKTFVELLESGAITFGNR